MERHSSKEQQPHVVPPGAHDEYLYDEPLSASKQKCVAWLPISTMLKDQRLTLKVSAVSPGREYAMTR